MFKERESENETFEVMPVSIFFIFFVVFFFLFKLAFQWQGRPSFIPKPFVECQFPYLYTLWDNKVASLNQFPNIFHVSSIKRFYVKKN